MMSTCEQIGGTRAPHRVEFIDVICADRELLRAEFDAIIDAAWESAPPEDPSPGAVAADEPRHGDGTPWFLRQRPHPTQRAIVAEGRGRQRSPPASDRAASGPVQCS